MSHSTCVYCGAEADVMDHVLPRCLGGSNHPSNLRPACDSCNRSKGGKDLTDWLVATLKAESPNERQSAIIQRLLTGGLAADLGSCRELDEYESGGWGRSPEHVLAQGVLMQAFGELATVEYFAHKAVLRLERVVRAAGYAVVWDEQYGPTDVVMS